MNLIHIGLNKTSSTFLQKNIFPIINSLRANTIFNDPELINVLEYAHLFNINNKTKSIIQKKIKNGNNL